MSSKIVSILALLGGLVSLPLHGATFTTPLINTLTFPMTHLDPGMCFLLCCGVAGLIVMRKVVR